MERKFDAFISYRHHPVDSAVAAAVQRQLEHFTIPRAVQKKTGKKRIEHIFRDKEELPVTSDLNDNIGLALSNSAYLIVICSPRTKESIWVQKEIESFLKTHSRENVLTVLAEGEPGEVIPEILLSEEITSLDAAGNEIKTIVPREPLSCDYRMGIRKAKSVELLRLAASILGCPFDDLKQRMHQYRMRRLTAIFSVILAAMLGFSGYVLWSSRKIQENYELAQKNYEEAQANYRLAQENYNESQKNLKEAQRKQSLQLAAYSKELLADGNRTIALQLALAALPDEDNDRPYVAEAEYALEQALYSYNIESMPRAMVTLPYKTKSAVSQKHQRYLYYDNNKLCLMNSETGELLQTVSCAASINEMAVSDAAGSVLVTTGSSFALNGQSIAGYALSDGSLLWEITDYYRFVSLSEDNLRALCYRQDVGINNLCVIDVKTGDILKVYETDRTLTFLTRQVVWAEDQYVARITYSPLSVEIIDLQTMEFTNTQVQEYDAGIYLTKGPDNSILIYGYNTDRSTANRNIIDYNSDGSISEITFIGDAYATLEKIAADGKKCWSYRLPFVQHNGVPSVGILSRADSDVEDSRDTIICYIANKYAVIDSDTGKELHSGELPGIITGNHERQDNTTSRFITEDGQMGIITPAQSNMAGIQYFPIDSYDYALSADRQNIYMRSIESPDLIHYTFYSDERHTEWEETLPEISTNIFPYGNYAVMYSYDKFYAVLDLESKTIISTIEYTGNPTNLGITKDGHFLYCIPSGSETYLYSIDVTTGKQDEPVVFPFYMFSAALMNDGKVLLKDMHTARLYDSQTGDMEDYSDSLPGHYLFNHAGTECLYVKDNALLLHTSAENFTVASTISADKINLNFPVEFSDDDSLLCYALNDMIYLWDVNRKELLHTMQSPAGEIVKIALFDTGNYLFCVTSDGSLLVYDISDGNLLNTIRQIFPHQPIYDTLRVEYTPDKQIAVWYAHQLFFLDNASLQIRQHAGYIFLYDKTHDEIVQSLSLGARSFRLNTFHHYTTEELMEQAKKALGNSTLSDEQKKMYGLD